MDDINVDAPIVLSYRCFLDGQGEATRQSLSDEGYDDEGFDSERSDIDGAGSDLGDIEEPEERASNGISGIAVAEPLPPDRIADWLEEGCVFDHDSEGRRYVRVVEYAGDKPIETLKRASSFALNLDERSPTLGFDSSDYAITATLPYLRRRSSSTAPGDAWDFAIQKAGFFVFGTHSVAVFKEKEPSTSPFLEAGGHGGALHILAQIMSNVLHSDRRLLVELRRRSDESSIYLRNVTTSLALYPEDGQLLLANSTTKDKIRSITVFLNSLTKAMAAVSQQCLVLEEFAEKIQCTSQDKEDYQLFCDPPEQVPHVLRILEISRQRRAAVMAKLQIMLDRVQPLHKLFLELSFHARDTLFLSKITETNSQQAELLAQQQAIMTTQSHILGTISSDTRHQTKLVSWRTTRAEAHAEHLRNDINWQGHQTKPMFTCTAIALLFLPLGFLPQYFAMDFEDRIITKQWQFWAIAGPVTAVAMIAVVVMVVVNTYEWREIRKSVQSLWPWRERGFYVPPTRRETRDWKGSGEIPRC